MEMIKITPDKEKAKSILKMVNTTLDMIKTINPRFSSNIVKEYYEVIRELLSIILLLDGFKTYGEYAHKNLIEYIKKNYEDFDEHEISLMGDLRIKRNKIAYDGFFVKEEYLNRNKNNILKVILKAKKIIEGRL